MIRHILTVLIMCGWCHKMFDPRTGACPECERQVYTPKV